MALDPWLVLNSLRISELWLQDARTKAPRFYVRRSQQAGFVPHDGVRELRRHVTHYLTAYKEGSI